MNLSNPQLRILRTYNKRGVLSPDDAAFWLGAWTGNIKPDIEQLMNLGCLQIWADGDTWAQTILQMTSAGRDALAEYAETKPVAVQVQGKGVAA